MNKKKIREFLLPNSSKGKFFLVLLLVISTILLFLPLLIDVDLSAFTALGILGLFLINFLGSATLFLPAPAIFSVALAAPSFNPIVIAFVAAIAAALGESVAFIFGYSSLHVLNLKKHKNLFRITKTLVHWKGGILIPLFSFVPNPFFDGLGIFAGISRFPIKKFLFFVFIGRFVRNLGIVYLGLFLWQ